MAGITKEERERRRRLTEAGEVAATNAREILRAHDAAVDDAHIAGKVQSKHWPGLFYSPTDPEPTQNNMLGTKDPVWRAWFERNGGKSS